MPAPARSVSHPAEPGAAARQEHLVFTLGAEHYAVDILSVREIRAFEGATRIAGSPPFVLGVINLRGAIVPVVDFRLRFGVGNAADYAFSVLIVFDLAGRLLGAVVDGVSDVIALMAEEIRPAPELPTALGSAHIRGLAEAGEAMLVVLDIESLMLAPETALVDAVGVAEDGGSRKEPV